MFFYIMGKALSGEQSSRRTVLVEDLLDFGMLPNQIEPDQKEMYVIYAIHQSSR